MDSTPHAVVVHRRSISRARPMGARYRRRVNRGPLAFALARFASVVADVCRRGGRPQRTECHVELRMLSLFVHTRSLCCPGNVLLSWFVIRQSRGGGVGRTLDGALKCLNVNVNDYKQQRGCDAMRCDATNACQSVHSALDSAWGKSVSTGTGTSPALRSLSAPKRTRASTISAFVPIDPRYSSPFVT